VPSAVVATPSVAPTSDDATLNASTSTPGLDELLDELDELEELEEPDELEELLDELDELLLLDALASSVRRTQRSYTS